MKKKRSNLQRKVLALSIVLALLIVAGGTFAWFTSKDEVTNKLTASNNYGVSIVESFTPPENWAPGQEVNKDVFLTNTGNIDAFVKASVSSAMNLTLEDTPLSITASNVTDVSKLVELSVSDEADSMVDEVKAIQAGGRLVYQEEFTVNANDGTLTQGDVSLWVNGESESLVGTAYAPTATGLYIFERSIDSDVVEYAGYYYNADTKKYYALASITAEKDGDGTITGFDAELRAKKQVEASDTDLAYDFSNITDPTDPRIVVTYQGSEPDGAEDVIINIRLAADWADNWTWNADEKAFYYNDTLKAGEATEKLIDSLELDEAVTNAAYMNFEYDLTITADSVQVTTDKDGKQTAEAVSWTLSPTLTYDADGKTIASVAWGAAVQP